MKRFVALVLASCFLVGPMPISAQSGVQPPGGPTIKAEVKQVLVPVVITDKRGRYVVDLTANDFSLYEDGVLQKIVAFSRAPVSVTGAGGEAGATAARTTNTQSAASNASPVRTYLICIDILNSRFENFARVRKALKEFFSHEQAGDSQYALFALGLKLHVLVDSTRDPSTILNALASKELLKTILDSEAANLAHDTQAFAELVGQWCGNCQCNTQQIDMANIGCPGYKAQVRSALLSFSERTAILDGNFLADLTRLVSAMASMPTKRTALFISDGFNRFAGEEFTAILRANDVNDLSLRFNPRDLQPEIDKLLKLAVRNNIRFYTIDSRGLYTTSAIPGGGEDASTRGVSPQVRHAEIAVAFQNADALAELAKQTGGAFFENNNDLLKGMRRAFADGREEYVLAYISSNLAYDGKFRRITVKVKDPKANVAAKVGYWANP